jgi:hypothetical protein
MRCDLALTLGKNEPAFVVMQFDHEKEVNLGQKGSHCQRSAKPTTITG